MRRLCYGAVAFSFGLKFLRRGFGATSGWTSGLRVWVVIFVLVMLQMSTALRPLVGTSPTILPEQKKFFLVHWMESLRSGEARNDYSEMNRHYESVRR